MHKRASCLNGSTQALDQRMKFQSGFGLSSNGTCCISCFKLLSTCPHVCESLSHHITPGVFDVGHANASIESGVSNEFLRFGVIAVGQLNFSFSRGSKG